MLLPIWFFGPLTCLPNPALLLLEFVVFLYYESHPCHYKLFWMTEPVERSKVGSRYFSICCRAAGCAETRALSLVSDHTRDAGQGFRMLWGRLLWLRWPLNVGARNGRRFLERFVKFNFILQLSAPGRSVPWVAVYRISGEADLVLLFCKQTNQPKPPSPKKKKKDSVWSLCPILHSVVLQEVVIHWPEIYLFIYFNSSVSTHTCSYGIYVSLIHLQKLLSTLLASYKWMNIFYREMLSLLHNLWVLKEYF